MDHKENIPIVYKQQLKDKQKKTMWPNTDNNYRTAIIISKMGAGKSFITQQITNYLSTPKTEVYFISSVKTDQNHYKDLNVQYLDQQFLDTPQQLDALYQHMEFMKNKEKKKAKVINVFTGKEEEKEIIVDKEFQKDKCQFIVIFDDIDINNKSKPIFKKMLRNYRHTNTLYIFTSQTVTVVLDKKYRELFNLVIFFKNIPVERLKMNIFPMLPYNMNFEQFVILYKDATRQNTEDKYFHLMIDTFNDPKFFSYIPDKNPFDKAPIQYFT